MNTKVSAIFLSKVEKLAYDFALARSLCYSYAYRKKVFNSTYKKYKDIAIYLYIRLYKFSFNPRKLSFNNISCSILKKFSCKLYRKVIDDLKLNKIIYVNEHYSNFKRT